MPLPAVAGAAIQLAPLLGGFLRKKKKGPNRLAIVERYRAQRPTGYNSAEDLSAAERTRTRMAGAAQAVAQQRRAENARQATARGLSGPAAAALEEQASGIAAGGAEEAARTSADQLYRAFQSNLGYERQKADTSFGAELGIATEDARRADASNVGFWNSVLELTPALSGMFSGGGGGGAGIVSRSLATDPSMLSTASDATLRDTRPRPRAYY